MRTRIPVLGLLALVLAAALGATPAAAAPFAISIATEADEVQAVKVDAASGTYRLAFGAGGPGVAETADIAATASAAELEAALDGLANVSAGGGSITVGGGPGGPGGEHQYKVEFDGGPLHNTDVPQLEVLPGTAPLAGGRARANAYTIRQGGVRRGDERIDYSIELENVAAPGGGAAEAGEAQVCAREFWFPFPGSPTAPLFSYQWYRDGQPIAGATTALYIATAADAGKPLQCLVRAENSVAASAQPSLPVAVVDPQPATAPPQPSDPEVAASRPGVNNDGAPAATKRTCTPPTNWTGGPTWTYGWLLNGAPVSGVPSEPNKYQPAPADAGEVLQCVVRGTNAGGTVLAASKNNRIGTVAEDPAPEVWPETAPRTIADPATVELELPGGAETSAYRIFLPGSALNTPPDRWACAAKPAAGGAAARAICASAQELAPGASYEPLGVAVALGADAPDHATATACANGYGAAEAACAADAFDFGPPRPFGVEAFEAAVSADPEVFSNPAGEAEYTQAGGHPASATARVKLPSKAKLAPLNQGEPARRAAVGNVRDVVVDTPRGFVGNALAVPEQCPSVEDLLPIPSTCPDASAVGAIFLRLPDLSAAEVIYSVEPEFGVPAQFAFSDVPLGHIFVFAPKLRADDGYAISLAAAPAPLVDLQEAVPTLCGFGLKARRSQLAGFEIRNSGWREGVTACYERGEPGANPTPLISFPTRCDGPPPRARLTIDSAEQPGRFDIDGLPDYSDPAWKSAVFDNPPVTGCEKVPFEPRMNLAPTSRRADSPTGLDVELSMPTAGLEGRDAAGNLDPEALAQANLKGARVSFPPGMSINPSAGNGLGGCAADGVDLGTNRPIACPDDSKVGTIEIDTPLISETLTGAMYIGKQADAPPGALIPLYLVFESARDGILIKIPAKVVAEPDGRLMVELDESPEDPFSAVRMHFAQGPRASLINPPRCGTYQIEAELFPWTGGPSVHDSSTFYVTEGPGNGSCPRGDLEPSMEAGTLDNSAAKPSPFVLRLTRPDGSDRFRSLKIATPPGLTAYLKGVPYCPDSTLASISAALGTGQAQIDGPSCPADSQIGTLVGSAGAGPDPFYATHGRAYLAGPYEGAPVSIAVVVPAVAGPLDLGSIVVRNAVHVDPETAQISAESDPLPTIWHGVPLDVRELRIAIDRPHFTRNPTDCDRFGVSAEVGGAGGGVAKLLNAFQAAGCGALRFRPKLGVRLFGGTRRGGHPRLKGVITANDGEATIGEASVTIPRSEFLDQGHIRTVCTRVQFRAEACPKGATYGHAKAWTPLLDYPVQGPVYLRSSDNYLPDLVVDLKGPAYQPIEAVVVGRIDSIKGQIRTTFESTPDVPVSRFVLQMQGGKKGLLVNSRNICATRNRATVRLTGHNEARHDTRPLVRNGKCGKQRRAGRRHHRRHKVG